MDYTNTWYDMEPSLDITNVSPIHHGKYDFIISSEVFEHVAPSSSESKENEE